ncbi:MAG: PqqD family protein [Paludibacter sp.]|nr:PqqD family protein [Paludibacter sp.]
MKLRKNIATSEEGFIFNPTTGDSFSTNPIGADILTLLKEEKSFPAIIKAICVKYEVNEIQFEKDLDDFVSQLKDFSILDLEKDTPK